MEGQNYDLEGQTYLKNSCLTNLPMYMMGFYMLPKGVHGKMDMIRSKFFWQAVGDTFKYHMAKWISVCKPKIHGGLGIIFFNEPMLNS
jgi:hypothetical protein